MESGNSEVAWRMERIRLEYESAQRGLMGVALTNSYLQQCGFLIWYILYQFGWVYSKCTSKFVQCGCGYLVVGVSPNRLYRFIGHVRLS